jgi:hypothetical protein
LASRRIDQGRVARWLLLSLESDEPRSRLEKRDHRGADGAFFELALESHFRARRVPVAKPMLPSGRPDLLIHDPGGDVYLEIATVFDEPFWDEAERRSELVAGAVQRVVSPYWISLQMHERDLPPDIAPRKVRSFVLRIVAETKAGRFPLERTHAIPGTRASFHLWGDRPEETMPLGITRSDVRALNGHVQVERALNDKAAKYPEITAAGVPYVVAICTSSWFAIGEEQILSGVYGTRQITIYVPQGPVVGPIPSPSETRRGGMLAQRPDGDFNNREISAVLYVWEDFETRGESRLRAKVLHHPDPLVPLPRSVFAHLPQTQFQRMDDDHVSIEFTREDTELELD